MCRKNPNKKVTHKFILASPAVPTVLLILLGWFVRWEVGGRTTAVLYVAASRMYGCITWILNEMLGEEARWEIYKDAASFF